MKTEHNEQESLIVDNVERKKVILRLIAQSIIGKFYKKDLNRRLQWIIISVLLTTIITGCATGISIEIKTSILNLDDLPGDVVFTGDAKLLLVPTTKFSETSISSGKISGFDKTFVSVGLDNDFSSIPLTKTINSKIKNIEPGEYWIVVSAFSVDLSVLPELGNNPILVLSSETSAGVQPVVLLIEQDGALFDIGPSNLIFLK